MAKNTTAVKPVDDKPHRFVSLRSPSFMLNLPPLSGGRKKAFRFYEHVLEFEPEDFAYRDALLKIVDDGKLVGEIEAVDAARAASIAYAHSKRKGDIFQGMLTTQPHVDMKTNADLQSVVQQMLRQPTATRASVAETLHMDITVIEELAGPEFLSELNEIDPTNGAEEPGVTHALPGTDQGIFNAMAAGKGKN